MPSIEINTGGGLEVSLLKVKLDPSDGNECVIRNDGLYVQGSSMASTVSVPTDQRYTFYNTDFSNYSICANISPWGGDNVGLDPNSYKQHITGDCKTHRIWVVNSTNNAQFSPDGQPHELAEPVAPYSGKDETYHYRPEIDWVLPGDFFRIKQANGNWNYYIVMEVTSTGADGLEGHPGNKIKSYCSLLTDTEVT